MKKRRFTMVEMLVVIAIIVILAGMTFGVMKMVWRKNADAKTRERIQKIQAICDAYYKKQGYYPQYTGELDSGTVNGWADTAGVAQPDSSVATDFYKKGIFYKCPGTMNPETYDIWSMGADKEHGNNGGSTVANAQTREKNDDLTNWKGK